MDFSFLSDDVVKDEYGTWSQVCKYHAKNSDILPLGKIENSPPENIICGCRGCKNEAEYYIDFLWERITIDKGDEKLLG